MGDIENLLHKIESESNYGLLGDCYCLQGHVELGLFRIKKIEDVYQDAFKDFTLGLPNPFVTIGISVDQNELWRMKEEMIDNGKKDFSGNILIDDKFHVVEGEPTRNLIFTSTKLINLYDKNLISLRLGVNRNWLLLGVAPSFEIAQMHSTTVRVLGGRKEDPPKE